MTWQRVFCSTKRKYIISSPSSTTNSAIRDELRTGSSAATMSGSTMDRQFDYIVMMKNIQWTIATSWPCTHDKFLKWQCLWKSLFNAHHELGSISGLCMYYGNLPDTSCSIRLLARHAAVLVVFWDQYAFLKWTGTQEDSANLYCWI